MKLNKSLVDWYFAYLGLMIFLFCFVPKLIGITTILLVVFVIVLAIRKELQFRFSKILLFFILIYLAYLIGVLFTDHLDIALKYLEYKLVLLLFPLLFMFPAKKALELKPIAIGLILGTVVASVLGLVNSYMIYLDTKDFNNSFGSVSFSYIHHPTYFSAFLLVGTLFSFHGFKQKWAYFNKFSVTTYFLFTLLMQFFCFSFAGLLFLLVTLSFFVFRWIYSKWKISGLSASIICIPFLVVIFYNSSIHIKIEIDSVYDSMMSFIKEPKAILSNPYKTFTGNETRLIMWTVSTEEFLTHPMGSGTGNVDEVLGNRLRNYRIDSLADKQYNPHNQYLQIAVEVGLVALLVFLFLLVLIFRLAYRHRSLLLMFLLFNFMFNSLFESMLQRQSGIVFYCLLFCILIVFNEHKAVNENPKLKTDK